MSRRIVWFTVSNAALRLRLTIDVHFPYSSGCCHTCSVVLFPLSSVFYMHSGGLVIGIVGQSAFAVVIELPILLFLIGRTGY